MKLFCVSLLLKLRTAVQTVFWLRSLIRRYEQNYISKYISFIPFSKSMCFRPLNKDPMKTPRCANSKQ